MSRRAHLLLVCAVLLFAAPAHALTVAIMQPLRPAPQLRAALLRLRGELLAVGLEVVVASRPPSGLTDAGYSPAGLERMASERKVDAIIDVVGATAAEAVDIWIFRPREHLSAAERVVLEPDTPNPAETLTIRAIEVLRSRFVEFDLMAKQKEHELAAREMAKAAPQGDPLREHPEASTQTQPAAAGTGKWGLAVGGVALSSMDRVGPAVLPLARLEWATPWPVVAHATVSGIGTQPRIETDAGEVRMAQQFALLGVSCCSSSESGFQSFLGVSAGALRTALDGQGLAPHQGHRVAHWSMLMEGRFGVHLRLAQPYYLTIASHIQLAQPYVAVNVVDSSVATTGRPNLLLSVTVGSWL